MALVVHGGQIEIGLAVVNHATHIVAVSQLNKIGDRSIVRVLHHRVGTAGNRRADKVGHSMISLGALEGIDVLAIGSHALRCGIIVGQGGNFGEAGIADGKC